MAALSKPVARQAEEPQPLPNFIGVDWGSDHVSASLTASEVNEGRTVEIPMDVTEKDGNAFSPTRLPTGLVFSDDGIKLKGFGPITDPDNTSSGLKQALDKRLWENPNGEGAKMHRLLTKYSAIRKNLNRQAYCTRNTLLDDGITMTFEYVWERIVLYAGPLIDNDRIDTIVFTVPMIWHQSAFGERMQKRIHRCAVKAGFPADKIIFIPEQEAAFAYFKSLEEGRSDKTETEFVVEVGAGTVEVMTAETKGSLIQLLCSSKGCAGGMADVWTSIWELCRGLILKEVPNTSASCDSLPESTVAMINTLYNTVREEWVYKMDENSADFEHGSGTIEAEMARCMMRDCYKEAFALVKEQIKKVPNLTKVSILGRAPASNPYLKTLWEKYFEQCREDLRHAKLEAQFTINTLGRDIAAKAVHMGASIPFHYQPSKKFTAHAFGIIVRDNDDPKTNYIQEFKRAGDDAFCKWWENVLVNVGKPEELIIDPHTFSGPAQRLENGIKSRETGRGFYLMTNAVSMGPITVDLKGHVEAGQYVWIKFKWKSETVITLEVDCRRHRTWKGIHPPKDKVVTVDLELRDTANTVYAVPIRKEQQGEKQDEDEDGSGQENSNDAGRDADADGRKGNKAGVGTRKALSRKRRIDTSNRRPKRRKLPENRKLAMVEGARGQDKTVWDISSDEEPVEEEQMAVPPGNEAAYSTPKASARPPRSRKRVKLRPTSARATGNGGGLGKLVSGRRVSLAKGDTTGPISQATAEEDATEKSVDPNMSPRSKRAHRRSQNSQTEPQSPQPEPQPVAAGDDVAAEREAARQLEEEASGSTRV